jgi:glycine cleavage system H protein
MLETQQASNEQYIECNGQKVCLRNDRYYSRDHVWIEAASDKCLKIGVTDYAQKFLRESVSLVSIDSNEIIDPEIRENQKFGTIFGRYYRVMDSREYGCTAFDLISPVNGKLIQVNNKIMNKPELISKDPYGEGWVALVEVDDSESSCKRLMESESYGRTIADRRDSPFREL